MAQTNDELTRLRRSVRDLTALSALPLLWVDWDAPKVVASFLDIVCTSLSLDLAYARISDPVDGPSIEGARANGRADADGKIPELRMACECLARARDATSIADPFGRGASRATVIPFGDVVDGALLAASRRPDFPSAFDAVILGAAVNQITIWLRGARHAFERAKAVAALGEAERVKRRLQDDNAYLREEMEAARSSGGIIGQSGPVRALLGQIARVAPAEATVLIQGESGTGKELVAREIHTLSTRADRPLVVVNCSAIPKEMFESEFFGHIKGAFTGALRDRPGRFQLADGGTIFLDEIGELPREVQPKLLRILQEGEFERVGDDETRTVNVRVIAATNRNLQAELDAGRFREDLFYRLSVFPIEVPPLRARPDDIPVLAAHFAALAAKKTGIAAPPIADPKCEALKGYHWPGNIRELQNLVERTLILTHGEPLRLDHALSDWVRGRAAAQPAAAGAGLGEIVPENERRSRELASIVAALKHASGRVQGPGGAAELLGLRPSTLQSRIKALGIKRRRDK